MQYLNNLISAIKKIDLKQISKLEKFIISTYKNNGTVFLCGNGGSSANADHIANDFSLGFGKKKEGFKFMSLSSNNAVISCIANDISYDKIYSYQLRNIAQKKDMLIVLSGSGNSKNIINAINQAKKYKMKIFGILGFDGGKAKKKINNFIHVNVKDMQISEDMQMITLNLVMKNIIKKNFFKIDSV